MKKYFDASSAREVCDKINNRSKWVVELENILKKIESAAKRGETNICEFIQYETTKDKLLSLGYNVSLSCKIPELRPFIRMDYMKISW